MGKFFIARPIFAIALAAAIVLLGIISIFDLPIEQYPDITPPVVEVSTTYPGADAETVNNAVATPVSQSIMGVSDMLYMQATSANDGSMNLQVTFDIGSDPNMDAIFTQNNVSTALSQLPASVTQQGVTTRKTMTGFLIVYSLTSDGRYTGDFLSNYAYINIQNELLKIDGVGKVDIMGAGEYAMRIWLKPDLLDYYKISLDEVFAAVEAQGGIFPAGKFGGEPAAGDVTYTYTVTMPPQIYDAEQFGDIIISTTPEGEQVRLSDIADVALGSRQYGVESLFNSDPTALLVIYQQPGSNAVDVGNSVKAEMERLSKRFPDGITYTSMVDATTSIEAGVKDIFVTLIIALILVIAIIFLFLQDWRATLIPLLAIPVSIIGAFALFPLLGFSINIISLLGMVLAIGLVVDDAIVVVGRAGQYREGAECEAGDRRSDAQRLVADRRYDRRTAGRVYSRIVHGEYHGSAVPAVLDLDRRIGLHLFVQCPHPFACAVRVAAQAAPEGAEGILRRFQPLVRQTYRRIHIGYHPFYRSPEAYRRNRRRNPCRYRRDLALPAFGLPARRGSGVCHGLRADARGFIPANHRQGDAAGR